MKKITLLLLLLISGLSYGQIYTVPGCSDLGSVTYGPMYNSATANATNRTAVIYPASQLVTIAGKELTSAYFKRVTATGQLLGAPTLKIYLKEVAATDWGTGGLDWATATTGAVLVYDSNPATATGATAGWKNFDFSTNFTYSGTQNLAVFMEYTNPSASTTITWNYEYNTPCVTTTNDKTTKYSNNTTGTLPATLASTDYRRPFIGFDFVVSCPAPTGFATQNLMATSVNLNWVAGGSETSWEYAILPSASPAPATGTVIGTNSVTNAPLTPNTSYTAYVRAICGGEDNSVWKSISFTSPCLPVTALPWNEGFEGVATVGAASFPPCWTKENGDWSTAIASTYNTPRTGTKYLRDYYLATNEYMWTPGFELVAGTSYDFATFVQGDNHTGWVVDMFYNNSASSTGATQLGGAYAVAGTGTTAMMPYVEMRRSFVPTTSGVYYFAVRVNSTNTASWYVAFDDFSLEVTPTCPALTAVQITDFTASSAVASWTGPSEATTYNVEYGVAGFTPGTGTIVSGVTSPFSMENLSANTTYNFYAQSVCADSQSTWSGPHSFTTNCASISTLPWSEGFEGVTTVGATSYPPCWTKENGDWSTAIASTYNTPRTGTKYLRDYYLATNEYMWTPGFELVAGTSYDFATFVQGDNHTGWVVDMFYNTAASSEGATQLGASYTLAGTGTTAMMPYVEMRRSFVPTTTGVYHFAVRVNSTNTSAWYVAFDDFSLEVSPACPALTAVQITDVTSSSAIASWTGPTQATTYNVEYGVSGFTPGTGTIVSAVTSPFTIENLDSSTTYDFYAQVDCTDSQSSWSGPYSFTTGCAPFTVPTVSEGFETTSVLPTCWSRGLVTGTNNWEIVTPAGFGDVPTSHSGTKIITKTYTSSDALLYTNALDYSDVSEPTRINVWLYRHASANANDKYRFYVNTVASLTGATQISEIFLKTTLAPIESATGWYNYTIEIPEAMQGEDAVYIIIRGTTANGFSSYSLGIDDFKVEFSPEMSAPSFDRSALKVYPNPVEDILTISYNSSISNVVVYNLLGQPVLDKVLNSNEGTINVEKLASGTYIIKVNSDDQIGTYKFIKK